MEGASTDSLRLAAPKWNLAGDNQLLDILNNTHQRIISKCQDVNSKLEQMASALDDSSINLQNVNNKFMALSNSQFIESRVYDDDEDLTTATQPVQEPPPAPPAPAALRASLAALQRAHDTQEILDDTDSDSDAEPRYLTHAAALRASLAALQRAHDTQEILDDTDSDSDAEPRYLTHAAALRASLAALQRAHDTQEILDDTDSDSDAEPRYLTHAAALRASLAALQRAHDTQEILDDTDSDSDAEPRYLTHAAALRASLAALQRAHDTQEILDDTDSDSDAEPRYLTHAAALRASLAALQRAHDTQEILDDTDSDSDAEPRYLTHAAALRASLAALQRAHDTQEILDDTDSDSDAEPRYLTHAAALRASLAALQRAHDTQEILDDTDSDSDAEPRYLTHAAALRASLAALQRAHDTQEILDDTDSDSDAEPRYLTHAAALRASLAALQRAHDTQEILDDTDSDSDAEPRYLTHAAALRASLAALQRAHDTQEILDDTDSDSDAEPRYLTHAAALRASLAALQRAHDTQEILDDTDSDSDAEPSVVMKPKDMYSHRPLPYIIGSQQWMNKWHAGLIVEESDSDSSTSKRLGGDMEQYSDSDSEAERIPRPPAMEDPTISETSSSFNSEHPVEAGGTPPPPPAAPAPRRPADIAAELARRLGGAAQIIAQEPDDYAPPVPTIRKVYKPEQPATSNIFPDEPPPLDAAAPEQAQSEDDDIFAEINKNKPYKQRNTVQDNLTEDLFRFDKPNGGVEQGDIFNDFAPGQVETKPSSKQKSTLFDDESEPELFAEPPPKREVIQNNNNVENREDTTTKKPVGGISLFGSNKGTESIGAAILNRNRRKSSTSGDESGSEKIKDQNIQEKPKIVPNTIDKTVVQSKTADAADKAVPKKEKDIFDDLFAKSEKATQKKPVQKAVKEPVKVKDTKNVKDLFSDNIFDDIDDIFTSNVKMPSKDSHQKSIFDDDDDDLFSDIAKSIKTNQPASRKDSKKTTNEKKTLFDSDDDLFSDIKTVKTDKTAKDEESQNAKPFDRKEIPIASKEHKNQEAAAKVDNIVKPTETTKERNLFDDSPQRDNNSEKPPVKSKGIFDSDSDEDIFTSVKKQDDNKTNKNVLNLYKDDTNTLDRGGFKPDSEDPRLLSTENVKETSNVVQSPSLFEEEEIDDLFINSNKLKSVAVESKDMKIAEVKHISSILKDTVIESDAAIIEKVADTFSNASSKENNILSDNFNEPPQMETEKSVPIPTKEIVDRDDIFDDNLLNNDLFSLPKKITNDMPKQNVIDEVLTPEVIDTSQEVSESTIEKAKDVSDAKYVNTEPQFDGTNSFDDNTNVVVETNEPKLQDVNQSFFDDFLEPVKEKEVLTTEQKKTMSNEPSIFDDILTEPPAFEKISEPKKSKNVNALFDDDSDDESLFFKKNDVISDEKPEIFSSNANFDIFISEPPAIDVDFTTKPAKNINLNVDDDDDDDEMFRSVPKMKESVPKFNKNLNFGDNDEDLFNSVPKLQEIVPDNVVTDTEVAKIEINKPKIAKKLPDIEPEISTPEKEKQTNSKAEEKIGVETGEDFFSSFPKQHAPKASQLDEHAEPNKAFKENVVENNKPTDEFDDILNSKESPKKEGEAKKIGKLNTKNLNINVNALIPGASPKKVPKDRKDEQSASNQESDNSPTVVKLFPTSDETDHFQPKSHSNKTESDEKDDTKDVIEPKPAKSITFEEKPESDVLDNNASKQRARIQVKRRPSTRRARHEAARRSAIDFNDDTDNSSSFDEPVKSRTVKSGKVSKEETDSQPVKVKYRETAKDDQREDKLKMTPGAASETVLENEDSNIFKGKSQKANKEILNASSSDIKPQTSKVNQNVNEQKTTTKVVYILNDEDIFNTGPKNLESKSENDLFGAKNAKTKSDDIIKSIERVNTLGKTYKEHTSEPTEELFKKVETKTKMAAEIIEKNENLIIINAKSTLFDDSDEELFNRDKKAVKKTNIFDSDSEEDLFGGKKRTEKQSKEEKNQEVKDKKEVKVKESLFGDDDDDDLFGVKKDITEPKPSASKPSTSKETSAAILSKTAEPVFDDPLSMLGDDD